MRMPRNGQKSKCCACCFSFFLFGSFVSLLLFGFAQSSTAADRWCVMHRVGVFQLKTYVLPYSRTCSMADRWLADCDECRAREWFEFDELTGNGFKHLNRFDVKFRASHDFSQFGFTWVIKTINATTANGHRLSRFDCALLCSLWKVCIRNGGESERVKSTEMHQANGRWVIRTAVLFTVRCLSLYSFNNWFKNSVEFKSLSSEHR